MPQGLLSAFTKLQNTPKEISLPIFLAFWVISLVIIQSSLQKLESSDETQDHVRMPLDVAYLIASDIQ